MKRAYKRILLAKWIFVLQWRVMVGRHCYSFYDAPLTVLRWCRRYAVEVLLDSSDHKYRPCIERIASGAAREITIRSQRRQKTV